MAPVQFAARSVTVTVAVPCLPSLVAAIVALPALRPVYTPEEDTVATVESEELQLITRPNTAFPWASLVTTDAWPPWPTLIVGDESVTVTLATGTPTTVTG